MNSSAPLMFLMLLVGASDAHADGGGKPPIEISLHGSSLVVGISGRLECAAASARLAELKSERPTEVHIFLNRGPQSEATPGDEWCVLAALAKHGVLGEVSSLGLTTMSIDTARLLATQAHLPKLTKFRVVALMDPDGESARLLFGSDLLSRATEIGMLGSSTPASKVLASWLPRTTLRELDLSESSLGDEGVRALAEGASKSGLRVLNLSNVGMSSEGAVALAATNGWTKIRRVDLSANPIGDAGASALATSDLLFEAEEVLLQRAELTSIGLKELLDALYGRGSRVDRLDLRGNRIDSAGATLSAYCEKFPDGRADFPYRGALTLNDIGDAEQAKLARAGCFDRRQVAVDRFELGSLSAKAIGRRNQLRTLCADEFIDLWCQTNPLSERPGAWSKARKREARWARMINLERRKHGQLPPPDRECPCFR